MAFLLTLSARKRSFFSIEGLGRWIRAVVGKMTLLLAFEANSFVLPLLVVSLLIALSVLVSVVDHRTSAPALWATTSALLAGWTDTSPYASRADTSAYAGHLF